MSAARRNSRLWLFRRQRFPALAPPVPSMSASIGRLLGPAVVLSASVGLSQVAHAQTFRFTLTAEPDVIPANGISTTSILVQVPQDRSAISSNPIVRFATTAGTIESQAQLSGGVARVLLRSSSTPGTAVVTAFVGSSREATTVEFSEDNGISERYLEVAAPYVAYGADPSIITAAGKTSLDFGELHISSDVRLDVDLNKERVWAQGNKGGITIRHGSGSKAKELHGDRLFYDLRRRQGVIRRADGDLSGTITGARQEFVGLNFEMPPAPAPDSPSPGLKDTKNDKNNKSKDNKNIPALAPSPSIALQSDKEAGSRFVVPVAPPTAPLQARDGVEVSPIAPPPTLPATTDATSPAAAANAADTGGAAPPEAAKEPETTVAPEVVPAPEVAPAAEEATQAAPAATLPAETDNASEVTPQESPTQEVAPQNQTEGPSTVVPGSLAAAPATPQGQETRITPLVTKPRFVGEAPKTEAGAPEAAPKLEPYVPLPENKDFEPRIVELPPPNFNTEQGYWVASRRLRVFPRDKVQFERASIYYNGGKAFAAPVYVLPLDGSFDPTTDLFAFNSAGGLSLKLPYYYQASKGGTGSLTLRREPGAGFGTQKSGFSLALDQQYWLSQKSSGKLGIDQIGNGDFNVNFQHTLQLDSKTNAALFVNAPQHRDLYARTTLSHDLKQMQIGLETFVDRPQDSKENLRGQFYARMRPKNVGKTGWTYTSGLNFLAVQNTPYTINTTDGIGGGIHDGGGTTVKTRYRSLLGQTLNASLQSPGYKPWSGAQFTAGLSATAFNYSNNRRGVAPGVTLGLSQHFGMADLRVDYTYDRSSLGLYGSTSDSYTHYLSSSLGLQLAKNIGFSTFVSKSLQDESLYGSADLSYYFLPHWRSGLFTDFSRFNRTDDTVNYGLSIGRSFAGREVTLNWDALRGKFYLEIGQGNY